MRRHYCLPTDGHGVSLAALVLLLSLTVTARAATVADLSVTATVDQPAPPVGAEVTFTVSLANAGPDILRGAVLLAPLPSGYTYTGVEVIGGGTYFVQSGLWTVRRVRPGTDQGLRLTATTDPAGDYTFRVEVITSTAGDPDSVPGNGDPTEDDYAAVVTTPMSGNDTPVITGQRPLATDEDTPLTITLADLTVSDPDNTYPDDFTLAVLPGSGYSITAPGEITPDRDLTGVLTVGVTVDDGTTRSPPFELEVTVNPINDAPVITGQAPLTTTEGTPLTITLGDLTVADPDNLYPDDFTLALLPGDDYTLSDTTRVTPDAGFQGTLTVPAIVNDGSADSAPFDLQVSVGANEAPDIILIMLDDLDRRTLEDALLAGLMPNLQSGIIDRALEFDQSYVTNPICCPSRASFLSGQYSHNHGLVSNSLRFGDRGYLGAVGAFDDSDTVATRLQGLGYRTAHIGKYLNGYGRHPADADISPAFEGSYVPPGWDEWHTTVDPFTYCVYNYPINHNGEITNYDLPPGQTESTELYQTNVLADLAEGLLRDNLGSDTPLFLTLVPLAPHWEACDDAYGGAPLPSNLFARRIRPAPEDLDAIVPAFQPGPAYDEDTSDKPDFLAAVPPLSAEDFDDLSMQYDGRIKSLLSVDRLIGRVLAALGARIDNTVIIFTSDNGWLYGDHRLGEKVHAYDESARVPLYVRMPGATQAARRDNLVINNDLAPTILEIASPGYPDDDFDGRSFAPLLTEADPPGWVERARVLIEHERVSGAPIEQLFPTYYAIRTPQMLYTETFGGNFYAPGPLIGLEYYDVVSDPWQLESLIRLPADPPDPVLTQQLQLLRGCAATSCKEAENGVD